MKKIGIAELPLHYGRCPPWLFQRMKKLGKAIVEIIVYEYGKDELLKRLADPYFFQSLGCVLGYDFHSSGVTTTVCGALKEALKSEEIGVCVAGGKGKISLKTPEEIEKLAESLGLATRKIEGLKYASKMAAKVDNAVLQDGYQLYHHVIIFTEDCKWTVIQQGMCTEDKTARRYHWLSSKVKSFVEEPHSGIATQKLKDVVLNMIAKKSKEARKTSVDLVRGKVSHLKKDFILLKKTHQKSLLHFFEKPIEIPTYLKMPKNVNWKALEEAYDFQPKNYEELIGIKGIGPATVRGLALVSQLIYGKEVSWKEPIRYSYAYGGKDGVPRPVDKKAMDESIKTLKAFIEQARLKNKEKLSALRRLKGIVPKN